MEALLPLVGFAALVGYCARARGRSMAAWFVLSLFITPLIAGVILAVVPDQRPPHLR